MGISVRGIVSLSALVAAASLALPASAQPGPRQGAVLVAPIVPPRATDVTRGRLALEGALDPDEYIVGPGDVFTVSIGGSAARQVTSTVSADGRLVIPEAGTFVAAGRTLARVRAEAQAALQRRNQNITADVALSEPRQFYIHVAGRIPEPGRHLVPAVARVEDALAEAGGDQIVDSGNRDAETAPPALARYDDDANQPGLRWPALRNVSVERRTGARLVVDLMRYLATGDLAANPYLQDGDALYVPTFDPLVEGVVIGGAVDRPGTYDVRPGDTALDLIAVTSGTDPSARIARVRRVRPARAGASETQEVPYSEAASLDVRARDQIYAVPSEPDANRARVNGAVRYPGTYPITEGETTLAALVEMAGGVRDDALLRGAYLERYAQAGVVRPISETQAGTETSVPTDVSVATDLLGGLFGRQFFFRQTQQVARVSIAPEQAVAGTQQVPLRGGDVLTIPFDYGLVRVYGRVQRGGYVPFTPQATVADYIAQAGGLSGTASDAFLVDAATGQLTPGGEQTVQPGDAVFVNSLPTPDTAEYAQLALQERQDARDDARDRRQARFQLIQTALSVAATVTSAVIAYFTIQAVSNQAVTN